MKYSNRPNAPFHSHPLVCIYLAWIWHGVRTIETYFDSSSSNLYKIQLLNYIITPNKICENSASYFNKFEVHVYSPLLPWSKFHSRGSFLPALWKYTDKLSRFMIEVRSAWSSRVLRLKDETMQQPISKVTPTPEIRNRVNLELRTERVLKLSEHTGNCYRPANW